jgi:hypothetical protein
MARARNIKPSFFTNEVLGTEDPFVGLLFIGLWCLADKNGILENRPARIKAELFPYRDKFNVNRYLTVLQRTNHVLLYTCNGKDYIKVVNFEKHQHPHHTEKLCKLSLTPLSNGYTPSDSLIPDSLIPDSNVDSLRESSSPTAKTIPPCPVQKILDTYHRVLPTLTRVVAMNDTRRKMLSTRWRELYEAGDFETQDGGVETFESYFLMVKDSQFLMGKANGANGRKPFMADFEWLIRPQNFLKVIEGKYHGNA